MTGEIQECYEIAQLGETNLFREEWVGEFREDFDN